MLNRDKFTVLLGIFTLGLMSTSAVYGDEDGERLFTRNAALGKIVAASGQFFVPSTRWLDPYLVDFSTVTDGFYLPRGQRWDRGAVWWNENEDGVQRSLHVFLGETFVITQITVQVDDNDDYLVSWKDVRDGPREESVTVTPAPLPEEGMVDPLIIKVDAVTNAFKIEHVPGGRGDGFYSISEFQAKATRRWRDR